MNQLTDRRFGENAARSRDFRPRIASESEVPMFGF